MSLLYLQTVFKKPFYYFFYIVIYLSFCIGSAQNNNASVFVDSKGIMRWSNSNTEVKGFGVNYTVPFAHAYRSAQRLGMNPKQAIDNDLYHFSKLEFDLYRVHVWDTEISDVNGHLLNNEHLDAFDYLIAQFKAKGFNFVITPIAFWGNGWPEPDTDSPGFSHKYGKADCLTNPEAIKAQTQYLKEFLNHVNPYTGIAYKDEGRIIAFEVSNEPHHSGKASDVTHFVKTMVNAIKQTGTTTPVFYNISHGVHFVNDYFKAGIQGGTFQWYPTGLGYKQELFGNLLPNVNDYNIPFNSEIQKHHGAKLVYEFDAADVSKSYIYPAVARSFRTAGIQVATQFAYDPTFLANVNTEYNTHYMNLVYTPQKALSLKICSKIFHEVPLYSTFGVYPNNTSFGNVSIDYEKDLAEYNSNSTFIYTNTTTTVPKNASDLNEISGFGNSSVVNYSGTGAYFLDKLDSGIWRLEVLPDAVWVNDPFGKNSPNKTVAVINWKTQDMHINLPNLSSNFNVKTINANNTFKTTVSNGSFKIRPGTYLLQKNDIKKTKPLPAHFKGYNLNAFFAPETTVSKTWLKHDPVIEITAETPLELSAQIISPDIIQAVHIEGYVNRTRFKLPMSPNQQYLYTTTIPAEKLPAGFLNYRIVITLNNNQHITYPSGTSGLASDWDVVDVPNYTTKVVPKTYPIHLFDALRDSENLVIPWRNTLQLLPTDGFNEAEYTIRLDSLFKTDSENLNAKPIYDFSFKHNILGKIEGRKTDLKSKKQILIKARSLNTSSTKLQLAMVTTSGAAYGQTITLTPELKDYSIQLSELKPVKTVTLPRPYPSFLPYYLEHNITNDFDIEDVESLQFSIGPELSRKEQLMPQAIGIVNVRLD
ncbi:hypothetical protein [Formosa sp. A9]|uniref:hypothetical protein n=1 Tax=Formosa sp. A9 TaxID=3442641 RepID=UPI003EB7AD40